MTEKSAGSNSSGPRKRRLWRSFSAALLLMPAPAAWELKDEAPQTAGFRSRDSRRARFLQLVGPLGCRRRLPARGASSAAPGLAPGLRALPWGRQGRLQGSGVCWELLPGRTKFQSPGRGPYLRGGGNRAAVGEGPGHAPGKATRWSVAKVPAPNPCHWGISSRLSARMAAERVLGPASVQSGSPGEGANFFPLVVPPWAPRRSSGTGTGKECRRWIRLTRAADLFAPGWPRIRAGEGQCPARRSSAPPPGPGLFRPGVTEAGEWERRRPPSAARDGG
ncbi:hypothetical protein NN561_013388 [Cricetulus griseus]